MYSQVLVLVVFAAVALFALYWKLRKRVPTVPPNSSPTKLKHSRPRRVRRSNAPSSPSQPIELFLVLDVEATCQQGCDFNYPNEIIVRNRSLY